VGVAVLSFVATLVFEVYCSLQYAAVLNMARLVAREMEENALEEALKQSSAKPKSAGKTRPKMLNAPSRWLVGACGDVGTASGGGGGGGGPSNCLVWGQAWCVPSLPVCVLCPRGCVLLVSSAHRHPHAPLFHGRLTGAGSTVLLRS
jgi:hypothetical protein